MYTPSLEVPPINPKLLSNYKFAVYNHQLIIHDNRLITRKFIVIKRLNIITNFTTFHNHIRSSSIFSKSISDDGNNRFTFIVIFLNYVFIENYQLYEISLLSDLTLKIIQDFFNWYGINSMDNLHKHSKSTVDRCAISIFDFLVSYINTNQGKCILKTSDLVREITYQTKRGYTKKRLIPNIEIYHSGKPRTIFRDMPNSVFNYFISYAMTHHKDIFFLIIICAFAGLRPSEACNVRQEISPLGPGLIIRKINGKAERITIDLLEEKNLRSDLISVGKIKKERKQGVYPKFLKAFEYAYQVHKEYISTSKFESAYCPMSINKQGKAMTYELFRQKFQKMTKELIPLMLNSIDSEVVEYAYELQEHNISPHIFRHWFSVKLVLYGEDIAGLQFWRGDKSPESALTYLQNKGELEKQLMMVNNEIFDYLNYEAAISTVKENK